MAADPLDFEATIENTLTEMRACFRIREVRFDPYQMQSAAQRLLKRGAPMVEFPQSPANSTEASQNLFELIKSRNLIAYADDQIRLAVQRAIAIETPRGWRIAKEKQAHKIDAVVALAMAALGAVQGGIAHPSWGQDFRRGASQIQHTELSGRLPSAVLYQPLTLLSHMPRKPCGKRSNTMVPAHALARHRAYLQQNPRGPVGEAGLREYRRFISKSAGGALDSATPRFHLVEPSGRNMRLARDQASPQLVARALKRSPPKRRRISSILAYDGPPRAIPLPHSNGLGSIDFDLLVLGRGMARDTREMRIGGRGMTRDQSAFSELEALLRERLGPDEAQKAYALVQRMLKEKDSERRRHEQAELCDFLKRHHDLDDRDLQRVRELVVHDAEMPSVERGQQGHEIGPEAWWTTRGRDRDAVDPNVGVSGRAPPWGPYDQPDEEQEEGMEPHERRDVPMGLDPPVSEAQRRAMFAAREGRSTLGIPKSVGEHFVGKAHDDEWKGSNRPPLRRAPPREEPEDSEEDRKIKAFLSRFSQFDEDDIERALELAREARKKQPRETSGSTDQGGPIPFRGMPEPGGKMVEMAGDAARSFAEMYPGAPPRMTRTNTKVFVR